MFVLSEIHPMVYLPLSNMILWNMTRLRAKFGQMLLNHGKWQNNKVVDSIWVYEATKSHYTSDGWAYRYFFWIYPGENVFWAAGHGGQTITVAPDKNLVAVVTAWPYIQDN